MQKITLSENLWKEILNGHLIKMFNNTSVPRKTNVILGEDGPSK